MASKFFTKTGEENFINTVIKNGLKIPNLPKYYILRLAINKSFRLSYYPLDHNIWSNTITYDGDARNEKEYNYEQILGKGNKNYETMLRAMFAFRHKDENIDFSDDSNFDMALHKYIHRGLLEIYNTYKTTDNFYQYLIDEFNLNSATNYDISAKSDDRVDEEDILKYCKENSIYIEIIDKEDSIRHIAYKIRLKNTDDYKKLSKDIDSFQMRFGLAGPALFDEVIGEAMTFYIYLPKLQKDWQILNGESFKADLMKYNQKFEIGAYCGRDMKNDPIFFDLEQCPHIFIAGTTGSGKSVLMRNLIISIAKLNSNVEFILIDPKKGAEFGIYENKVNISVICGKKVIKNSDEVYDLMKKLVDEMERRYKILDSNKVAKNNQLKEPLSNVVVVIDEVADLFASNKNIEDLIIRIAQKGRASGIFLILATQTPNSEILSQNLRANIPTRIALKTISSPQSKVIMDEVGAQNLLGKGDLYIKINGGKKILAFAPFIDNSEIRDLV